MNFVLGQRLHSYGFSTGGKVWIGLYLLAETAFVAWACWTRSRNLRLPATPVQVSGP